MSFILDFYRTAMGKKAVMAATGIVLFGFVLGHMIGNLKLYQGPGLVGGPAPIDDYAVGLRELGKPFFGENQALWIARAALLAAVLVHIHAAVSLTLLNRRARRGGYVKSMRPQASTYASRTMIWGGLIILLFVIYHIMHFTIGNVHPDFEHGAVYHNVVVGFQNPWVSGFYIAAQVALGFHLYHGLWSLFQTLGLNGPRINSVRHKLAAVLAFVIFAGNVSFPIAVLTGLVSLGG